MPTGTGNMGGYGGYNGQTSFGSSNMGMGNTVAPAQSSWASTIKSSVTDAASAVGQATGLSGGKPKGALNDPQYQFGGFSGTTGS